MESPEPAVISVELGGADEAVRLRWEPTSAEDEMRDEAPSAWTLEAEPDWRRLEGIRLVSARFDDGRTLGVAAVRPREARGHGDDVVIARLLDADGVETTTSDALVSVEYDDAGRARRLGIELWPEPESGPLRIAADRPADTDRHTSEGAAVGMDFRLDGIGGIGLYEVIQPA